MHLYFALIILFQIMLIQKLKRNKKISSLITLCIQSTTTRFFFEAIAWYSSLASVFCTDSLILCSGSLGWARGAKREFEFSRDSIESILLVDLEELGLLLFWFP